MPIFKYGSSEVIEAIVDGLFESLPLLSIDGFTGGLGDVQIPSIGIDGFTSDISGDISLPTIGVASHTESAIGAIRLLRPGVSGSAYEENYAQFYLPKVGISGGAGAEGTVSLGLLEFSGNAVLSTNGNVGINLVGCLGEFGASGEVEIPWDVSGEVTVITLTNGSFDLHGLGINGVMATESHVWLRRVGVSGYSGVGSFADVDVNLHLVGVAGECVSTVLASGTVEIPMVSLNGMTGVGVAADGEVSLNILVVDGDASTGVAADGDFSLSSIGVDGFVEHSQYANGTVHLMSYGASGLVSLYVERIGSGTVSVSRLGVSGLAFSEMIVAEGDDEVIRYSDDRRLI